MGLVKSIGISMLIMIVLALAVFAIGVSPVRKVVDYEPLQEHDLNIIIKNDAGMDIKALVYARGELESDIAIQDSLIVIGKDDGERKARYRLTMPAKLEKPGMHKTDIVVMEYPIDFGTDKQVEVSAISSVVSEVWVRVPLPGKYLEPKMYIEPIGEEVRFAIDLMNLGVENVQTAKATISIYGATYEEIGKIQTTGASVESKRTARITGVWPANANPGKYHAVAEINYDEKSVTVEDNFELGKLYISINGVKVNDFTLGDVAIFDISIESKWNEKIDNVYGELTFLDSKGSEYGKVKTAGVDLEPLKQGLLKAYWDTKDVEIGIYNIRILIHYAEKVTEKLIEAEVSVNGIRTDLGPTAKVAAQGGLGGTSLLTILVLVLIIINIGWFAYFFKNKKLKK